jgi:hypothetical protein
MLSHILQGLAQQFGRCHAELFKLMVCTRLKVIVDVDIDGGHDVILDVTILDITITAPQIFGNRRLAGYIG